VPDASKVTFNLHPPLLRSMGMDRKLQLGKGFRPAFVGLAKAKALRGTPLDPFGRAHVRRVERELSVSHTALVERLSGALSADSYDMAVQAAAASELVRGYEDIKLGNVERYRARLVELGV
jgi:indolepyruvate ferredoxin oxidoreductase